MNRLQAAGVGIATLHDWLGDGGVPVARQIAERRAKVCEACPKNDPGNWWDRLARDVVQVMLAQRRAKEAMNLHVSNEEKLHFCAVCHCDLKTKPWVPFRNIANRTSEKTWSELPLNCWMVREKQK